MAHLRKLDTPSCVVNIVPPRSLWDPIQRIRTQHMGNARCGPHFTLIEPFIAPENLSEATQLLAKAFATLTPFSIRLETFNLFKHQCSTTLFLEATTDRPGMRLIPFMKSRSETLFPLWLSDAFEQLVQCYLATFPQCNNLVIRGGGRYIPHMSVAQSRKANKMKALKEELERSWAAVEFQVNQVYVLARPQGDDPLQYIATIPLGPTVINAGPPHFGNVLLSLGLAHF